MAVKVNNDNFKPEFLKDHLSLFEEAKSSSYLSPSEEEFLQDLEEKYDKYGNATYLSVDQRLWLERIVERG